VTPTELVASLLAPGDGIIAVTGATGWFGATALDLLYDALGEDAPRRVLAYASSERSMTVRDGRHVEALALAELARSTATPDVLLHFAYLTRDKAGELGVDRYIAENIAITTTVLDAIAQLRPRRVVITSSGAVYGPGRGLVHDVLGDPYGALKRLDELAFRAAADEVGASCVIPRVFSVAGPRMTKPDRYALGTMLAMARAGGPVVIRSDHPVVRSYCGVDEVVALALWESFGGVSSTFDTGGHVVEMAGLATTVARYAGGCAVRRPTFDPSAAEDRYVGDLNAMPRLASRAGLTLRSLSELVAVTGHSLKTSAELGGLR